MKNILFVLIFISLKGFGQFPVKQSLASPTTNIEFRGAVHAVKGLINGRYSDTTAANAGHIDFYNGAQIFTTSDKILWLRDSVLNKWVQAGIGALVAANQGLSLSGTTVQLGQTIYQPGNPAAFAANREIPIGDYALYINNRTGTFTGADSAWMKFVTTAGGPGMEFHGKHGGAISFYPKYKGGTVFPGINFYSPYGALLSSYGYHHEPGAAGNKHVWLADMRDSTQFASIESVGSSTANWGTVLVNHITQLGLKGKVVFGSTLSADLVFGDVDNVGSTYLRDSVSTPNTLRVTDTTGYDILMQNRTTGLHKKIYAGLVGGGGGSTPGIDDVLAVGQPIGNDREILVGIHELAVNGTSGTFRSTFVNGGNTSTFSVFSSVVELATNSNVIKTTNTGSAVEASDGSSISSLYLYPDSAVFRGKNLTIHNTEFLEVYKSSVFRFGVGTTSTQMASPDGLKKFSVSDAGHYALGLGVGTTNNRLVGIDADDDQLGYITLGSGLSLSSGVLTASGSADLSYETISYSASLSVTYDDLRPNKKITFGAGNLAITNTSTINGSSGIYKVVQDGTGSRTLTINGTAITIRTAAGSATLVGWIYDGTDYDFDTNL